jgi:hypothetical protein
VLRHREHVILDKVLLGRPYRHVHEWMDEPYKWLGPKHRVLRHDPLTLFLKYGFSDEFLAGMLHVVADSTTSRRRRRGFLDLLMR